MDGDGWTNPAGREGGGRSPLHTTGVRNPSDLAAEATPGQVLAGAMVDAVQEALALDDVARVLGDGRRLRRRGLRRAVGALGVREAVQLVLRRGAPPLDQVLHGVVEVDAQAVGGDPAVGLTRGRVGEAHLVLLRAIGVGGAAHGDQLALARGALLGVGAGAARAAATVVAAVEAVAGRDALAEPRVAGLVGLAAATGAAATVVAALHGGAVVEGAGRDALAHALGADLVRGAGAALAAAAVRATVEAVALRDAGHAARIVDATEVVAVHEAVLVVVHAVRAVDVGRHLRHLGHAEDAEALVRADVQLGAVPAGAAAAVVAAGVEAVHADGSADAEAGGAELAVAAGPAGSAAAVVAALEAVAHRDAGGEALREPGRVVHLALHVLATGLAEAVLVQAVDGAVAVLVPAVAAVLGAVELVVARALHRQTGRRAVVTTGRRVAGLVLVVAEEVHAGLPRLVDDHVRAVATHVEVLGNARRRAVPVAVRLGHAPEARVAQAVGVAADQHVGVVEEHPALQDLDVAQAAGVGGEDLAQALAGLAGVGIGAGVGVVADRAVGLVGVDAAGGRVAAVRRALVAVLALQRRARLAVARLTGLVTIAQVHVGAGRAVDGHLAEVAASVREAGVGGAGVVVLADHRIPDRAVAVQALVVLGAEVAVVAGRAVAQVGHRAPGTAVAERDGAGVAVVGAVHRRANRTAAHLAAVVLGALVTVVAGRVVVERRVDADAGVARLDAGVLGADVAVVALGVTVTLIQGALELRTDDSALADELAHLALTASERQRGQHDQRELTVKLGIHEKKASRPSRDHHYTASSSKSCGDLGVRD